MLNAPIKLYFIIKTQVCANSNQTISQNARSDRQFKRGPKTLIKKIPSAHQPLVINEYKLIKYLTSNYFDVSRGGLVNKQNV